MLETFAPSYSLNSRHSALPISGTVEFMTSLKSLMEGCGWRVTQTIVGRGALLVGNLPTATPVQPGEVPVPVVVHKKQPEGDGRIGSGFWQYYDPIRQIPGGDAGVIWIKMGTYPNWASTAGELGAQLGPSLGATYVGMDTAGLPYGQAYLLFDNGPLGAASVQVFGTGAIGGTVNYVDPYYNVVNTTLAQFAVQGAGWELISADGTTYVEITERIDNLNYALPLTNPTAPYIRVKPISGTYQFLYPFSIQSAAIRYHFHVSDKQIIIWLDSIAGPAGRPSNIIISSLAFSDDPPAFLGSNIYEVLVVIGTMISSDGGYFSGDSNGNTAQVRDHLWYVRGVAQDFYSYNEGQTYSESHSGPGNPVFFGSGSIAFIGRWLDNGRNLLGTNKEPLAQTPWLVVARNLWTAPSWIAGKLRDAMLMSYAPAFGETIIKHAEKKWHLLASQNLGGVNLNGSLWLTAVHDSDIVS